MGERWDRDRFMYERERDQARVEDDRYFMRGGRGRDHSDERYDRRYSRGFEDDYPPRDRPRFHDEDPRLMPRREREPDREFERRHVMEKERERDYRRESPPRRPGLLRRQSSLDTYDRRPLRQFYEHEEYPPPARREDIRRDDFRAPAYTPIPLPKTRALPPPRRSGERFYEDIKIAEPDHYGDDEFRPYPERIQERQMVRMRKRRNRSRDSYTTRTQSHRSSSRSSSTSSRSSSSSSGGTTIKSGSEYPKKGKTRIPSKLVSKRALVDLGYPFFEEGHTIIIQKALGQHNIDELLRVSEEYKQVDDEIRNNRSSAGNLLEERREEIFVPLPAHHATPAPPPVTAVPPVAAPPHPAPVPVTPAPPPPPVLHGAVPPPPVALAHTMPAPPAVVVDAGPPPPGGPPAEYYERTVIRDVSPSRTATTSTTSWDSYYTHHHHEPAPLTVVERSRSRSRSRRDIRAEIKALERELTHRPKDSSGEREIVRAERLPDGQLVVYEERVEKVVEAHKPPRIEKDKKGRMSISVPKYR